MTEYWLDTWSDDMRTIAYRHATPTAIVPHLMALLRRKEGAYDMSWAQDGILGFWKGCLNRQYHRINPGFKRLVLCTDLDSPDTHSFAKSLMGTMGDIANYALMGICLLSAMFPNAYDEWLEEMGDED
jgi:hypothetical protein